MSSPQQSVLKGAAYLAASAFLFATMGVFIRLASETVNNETVVFARNLGGLLMLLPLYAVRGFSGLATSKFYMHAWRALVGLAAMYCFFYAIAKLPLSTSMLFTYSSPVFIPLVAWLFLHERITGPRFVAALLGLVGVAMVTKPDQGLFTWLSVIGVGASFLAAMAFVTVRALTHTEPATRIVFYFAAISTLVSAVPMFWAARPLTGHELGLLACVGALATISQICMSKAYGHAPASAIGPLAYLAIVFAGFYAWALWGELPDTKALLGTVLIFGATVMSLRDRTGVDEVESSRA